MKSNIINITTWPFRATSQAWKDLRKGRQIRKDQKHKQETEKEQTAFIETEGPCEETSHSPTNCQDKSTRHQQQKHKQEAQEEQIAFTETEGSHKETRQSLTNCQEQQEPKQEKREGWVLQPGEYPLRIEKLVHLDSNTRGTWVLEVKDTSAIVWKKEYRINEAGMIDTETVPQLHWPFPRRLQYTDVPTGDPDELLNWLCR
ncbi:hypothetical protein F5X97DRAFT_323067 [Nemania serpens]|nr:hypothetical protein F5X97DRAFT_323067 [Nemania serpens]